jgi:hypothetical protein
VLTPAIVTVSNFSKRTLALLTALDVADALGRHVEAGVVAAVPETRGVLWSLRSLPSGSRRPCWARRHRHGQSPHCIEVTMLCRFARTCVTASATMALRVSPATF